VKHLLQTVKELPFKELKSVASAFQNFVVIFVKVKKGCSSSNKTCNQSNKNNGDMHQLSDWSC